MRIGIDAGGTFTDFVILHGNGRIESFKLRSHPEAPARVIREGIRRAAGGRPAEIVHGSTVATNALLERKGARTAFVGTKGFADILAIGRQNRPELYNLTPQLRRPLVDLCVEADERTCHDGTVARRAAGLATLRRKLRSAGVDSIAVCLLHSYCNPRNEQAVAKALAGMGYLSISHQVSPEYREYERASTTVINAYVGPLMDRYLAQLEGLDISVLQSNGGFLTPAEARRNAVRTILSGPAGGAVGAAGAARRAGYSKVIGFDMGGTSTDVCLCDDGPKLTAEATVDGFPVRVPMLDIHTVGAGGGSIARVDEGGLLRVGPRSAGASPGPACYGAGTDATVTDAHVVLGRIAEDQFLGGEMRIDPRRSAVAVDRIARQLGLTRAAAAEGILRVANANMERAIRVVSVERGHDPRDFALVAFGGCGGLHACELAAGLGIRTVIVPRLAGALSALGMLLADRRRDYSASVLGDPDVERSFGKLEKLARRDMPGCALARSTDVRYKGQSYELTVPWRGRGIARPFHREHQRVYGYANPDREVEVVTVRVRATIASGIGSKAWKWTEPAEAPTGERRIRVGARWRRVPVSGRRLLTTTGPALVTDYGSTTLVPEGWRIRVDAAGNLIVSAER